MVNQRVFFLVFVSLGPISCRKESPHTETQALVPTSSYGHAAPLPLRNIQPDTTVSAASRSVQAGTANGAAGSGRNVKASPSGEPSEPHDYKTSLNSPKSSLSSNLTHQVTKTSSPPYNPKMLGRAGLSLLGAVVAAVGLKVSVSYGQKAMQLTQLYQGLGEDVSPFFNWVFKETLGQPDQSGSVSVMSPSSGDHESSMGSKSISTDRLVTFFKNHHITPKTQQVGKIVLTEADRSAIEAVYRLHH